VAGGDPQTLADELKRSVLGDIRDVAGVREDRHDDHPAHRAPVPHF